MLNKNEWNDFVIQNGGFFRQSFEWGEFQKSLGHEVARVQSDDETFAAQFIKQPLPLGRHYWYCPRGPIQKLQVTSYKLQDFTRTARKIAEKSGAVFVRVEPGWMRSDDVIAAFRGAQFREITKGVQPQETFLIDLTQKEEELLSGMHQKTRYNIGLAERRGVEVRQEDAVALEKLWPLFQDTAKRDKFSFHSLKYYQKMLEILQPKNDSEKQRCVRLWIAHQGKNPLAAAIVSYFGNTATYLHGAMDYALRQHMGPQLLHWRIIEDAKLRGFAHYDFGGISEQKWPGVTRFKLSFGGARIIFAGVFDLPLNSFAYGAYRFFHVLLK